jgi:hypothetical protein
MMEKRLTLFRKSAIPVSFSRTKGHPALRDIGDIGATSATSATAARHRRRCRDVSANLVGRLLAFLLRKFSTNYAGWTRDIGDIGATSAIRHRRRCRVAQPPTSATSAGLRRDIGDIHPRHRRRCGESG